MIKLLEDYEDTNVDSIKEQVKSFLESIDLQPLFSAIDEFVGAKLDYTSKIVQTNYKPYYSLEFESNDVTKYCGVFSKILDECVIDNFSTGVSLANLDDLKYWVDVHISYHRKNGGSNGMRLFYAEYTNSNGWNFYYN